MKLTLVTQPDGFFHELITQTLGKNQLTIRPETEFYLVNLLKNFMTTDQLYLRKEDGSYSEEPLVFLLKQALETKDPSERVGQFRYIGDMSLYVSGFFQDSLNRKLVDVDYYIEMGGGAYARVAHLTSNTVYEELSHKFPRFVDVLAEVSDQTLPKTEKDLLRLYEVWVRTRSERAAKALQEAGIVPNDTLKKDWQ